VLAKPDFVEPSGFTSNTCENIPIPVKIFFPPNLPLLNVFMISRLCLSVTIFELKHSDSQKAFGFGYLADDRTGVIN